MKVGKIECDDLEYRYAVVDVPQHVVELKLNRCLYEALAEIYEIMGIEDKDLLEAVRRGDAEAIAEAIHVGSEELGVYLPDENELAVEWCVNDELSRSRDAPPVEVQVCEEPGYGLPEYSVYRRDLFADARGWCGRWTTNVCGPQTYPEDLCFAMRVTEASADAICDKARELLEGAPKGVVRAFLVWEV